MVALFVTSCASSRKAVSERVSSTTNYTNVTNERDSVVVELHDTLTITKMITIRENEQGDTLRMTTVTERDRIRDRAQVVNKEVEVRVVRDTVYIEHRDTTSVKEIAGLARNEGTGSRASPWVSALKWIFWIIIAIGGLIIVIKVSKVFKIFV